MYQGFPMTRSSSSKHKLTFEERLQEEAQRFQAEAERLPPGSRAREMILQRVRQAEAALDITVVALSRCYTAEAACRNMQKVGA
jgi:hypothetical protein